jgi:hypothetical protein
MNDVVDVLEGAKKISHTNAAIGSRSWKVGYGLWRDNMNSRERRVGKRRNFFIFGMFTRDN